MKGDKLTSIRVHPSRRDLARPLVQRELDYSPHQKKTLSKANQEEKIRTKTESDGEEEGCEHTTSVMTTLLRAGDQWGPASGSAFPVINT